MFLTPAGLDEAGSNGPGTDADLDDAATCGGRLKIGDFGLACRLDDDAQRKTTICGTPNYIAPEVLAGSKGAGHSYEVDVWSIGVIAYALLVGTPPFQTSDVHATYKRIRANAYEFPSVGEDGGGGTVVPEEAKARPIYLTLVPIRPRPRGARRSLRTDFARRVSPPRSRPRHQISNQSHHFPPRRPPIKRRPSGFDSPVPRAQAGGSTEHRGGGVASAAEGGRGGVEDSDAAAEAAGPREGGGRRAEDQVRRGVRGEEEKPGGGKGGGGKFVETVAAADGPSARVVGVSESRGGRGGLRGGGGSGSDPGDAGDARAAVAAVDERRRERRAATRARQVRSIHWSPYDPVREVDADP